MLRLLNLASVPPAAPPVISLFHSSLCLSCALFRPVPPPSAFFQLKRLYNHLDIGVRFAGLSFNVVECSTHVSDAAGGGGVQIRDTREHVYGGGGFWRAEVAR